MNNKKTYNVLHLHIIHLIVSIICLVTTIIIFGHNYISESSIPHDYVFGLTFLLIVLLTINIVYYIATIFVPFIYLQKKIDSLGTPIESGKNGYITLADALTEIMSRQANIEIMKKEAEIDALQSQINPHFLYNTLETIRGQAIYVGALNVADTTKALADIFRYNISNKGTMISLDEELANIDAYMKIQQIRFDNKFKIMKIIEEDARLVKIPKLILQPIIENALKYGLEEKIGKGTVLIKAFKTEDELVITVKDDGIGINSDNLKIINNALKENRSIPISKNQKSHVGLSNINARIKLIYGNQYGITISSAVNIGTTVSLHLGILN